MQMLGFIVEIITNFGNACRVTKFESTCTKYYQNRLCVIDFDATYPTSHRMQTLMGYKSLNTNINEHHISHKSLNANINGIQVIGCKH